MTEASRQWNLEETVNNKRKHHRRNLFKVLRGVRDDILTASMKEWEDVIERTLRKQERALENKILTLEIQKIEDDKDEGTARVQTKNNNIENKRKRHKIRGLKLEVLHPDKNSPTWKHKYRIWRGKLKEEQQTKKDTQIFPRTEGQRPLDWRAPHQLMWCGMFRHDDKHKQ